jgi:hypothetical protein
MKKEGQLHRQELELFIGSGGFLKPKKKAPAAKPAPAASAAPAAPAAPAAAAAVPAVSSGYSAPAQVQLGMFSHYIIGGYTTDIRLLYDYYTWILSMC